MNANMPSAIYVWLVPSEQVLEQPGGWRIRKWDTEPFPEANFTLPHSCTEASQPETPGTWEERCAALYQVIGALANVAGVFETSDSVADALDVACGRGDVEKLLPWPKDGDSVAYLLAAQPSPTATEQP